jgi:hypothetical protein
MKRLMKALCLLWLIWVTILSAEIRTSGNEVVVSENDYRALIKLAREAEIRREGKKDMHFYIGVHAGTYGVGGNVGVIF